MFHGKLLRKVFEGTVHHPGDGVGWLTKELDLPFMPFAALHLSYPVHLEFSMPSVDVSVEIESASWNARHNFFTAICVSHYLIDLLNPENAETDLSAYLSRQVKLAWDSFNNEADFSA